MRYPKVSIVTITYNHAAFIKQALDGFLMQKTNFDYEVVISDDCSTDDTPKIIHAYAKKHPNIIKPILRKKNIGPQRNAIDALKHAAGDYIALCEGDDYWTDKSKLQLQTNLLDQHKELALCFHPVEVIYEDDPTRKEIYPPPVKDENFNLDHLLEENYIQTNSVMYRRKTYDKIPDNIMPLDWYLHVYHAQSGGIGFINKVMSVYRRHPGGLWWESQSNIDKLWKKYGLEHLRLYIEMSKIINHDQSYSSTLNNKILGLLSTLLRVDESKNGILHKALKEFPELKEPLIFYANKSHKLITNAQSKHMEEQAKIINHLKNELDDQKRQLKFTQTQLVSTRSELQKLKNTPLHRVHNKFSRKKEN